MHPNWSHNVWSMKLSKIQLLSLELSGQWHIIYYNLFYNFSSAVTFFTPLHSMLSFVLGDVRLECSCLAMETHSMKFSMYRYWANLKVCSDWFRKLVTSREWEWSILSQTFKEVACMTRCLILHLWPWKWLEHRNLANWMDDVYIYIYSIYRHTI